MTFFDPIHGLKEEENRLFSSDQKFSSADAEKLFLDATYSKSSTITQAATTAARLSDKVISVINKIINLEHPSLYLKTPFLNTGSAGTVDQVIKRWIYMCIATLWISRLSNLLPHS